jgi:hypothetical protein
MQPILGRRFKAAPETTRSPSVPPARISGNFPSDKGGKPFHVSGGAPFHAPNLRRVKFFVQPNALAPAPDLP